MLEFLLILRGLLCVKECQQCHILVWANQHKSFLQLNPVFIFLNRYIFHVFLATSCGFFSLSRSVFLWDHSEQTPGEWTSSTFHTMWCGRRYFVHSVVRATDASVLQPCLLELMSNQPWTVCGLCFFLQSVRLRALLGWCEAKTGLNYAFPLCAVSLRYNIHNIRCHYITFLKEHVFPLLIKIFSTLFGVYGGWHSTTRSNFFYCILMHKNITSHWANNDVENGI